MRPRALKLRLKKNRGWADSQIKENRDFEKQDFEKIGVVGFSNMGALSRGYGMYGYQTIKEHNPYFWVYFGFFQGNHGLKRLQI